VDRVAAEAGADLRSAAFFFGERLKGLRRAGVAVDRIPADAWVELFHALAARPARREAWAILVRRMAYRPGESLAGLLGELGLDGEPPGWRAMLPRWVEAAEREAYDRDPGRILRHATGQVMHTMRGRVPASVVVEAVQAAAEVRP
jgi:Glu-tRNA(Gln) amidotransferase subunit E-like FAD-binding protein